MFTYEYVLLKLLFHQSARVLLKEYQLYDYANDMKGAWTLWDNREKLNGASYTYSHHRAG